MTYYDNQFQGGVSPYYQPNQRMYTPNPYTPQVNAYNNIGNNNNSGGNNKIWVQGDAGAKSYLVAPNSTVDLWDSERQTIYIKSADASGIPTMKILDYTVRNEQDSADKPSNNGDGAFVSLDDFNVLKSEIQALREKVDKIKGCKCDDSKEARGNNRRKSNLVRE